jgi:hypothetical protein
MKNHGSWRKLVTIAIDDWLMDPLTATLRSDNFVDTQCGVCHKEYEILESQSY